MKSTMLMSGPLSQEFSKRYERLFKMLLDAIPSSVLLINSDLRIISANRNFLEKSHRSMANTIGFKLESIFPLILLDQMDMASRIRQVFGTNQSTRGERMTYRAPGIPMRILNVGRSVSTSNSTPAFSIPGCVIANSFSRLRSPREWVGTRSVMSVAPEK